MLREALQFEEQRCRVPQTRSKAVLGMAEQSNGPGCGPGTLQRTESNRYEANQIPVHRDHAYAHQQRSASQPFG